MKTKPTRTETLKRHLPTVMTYVEAQKKKRQNQLPKHLRPPTRSPLAVSLVLNLTIIVLLSWTMWNRDEFVTEAAPAAILVISSLLLFYTLPTSIRLKKRFTLLGKGTRLAKLNVWVMALALLMLPASITFFLP